MQKRQKTKNEAELLSIKKDAIARELHDTRLDIKECKRSSEAFAEKIEVLEKNKEASERYQEIKTIIKAREQKIAELKGRIGREDFNINLLDKLWILAPFSSILSDYQKKVSAFSKEKRRLHDAFLKEQGAQEAEKKFFDQMHNLANGVAPLPWYLPNKETMQEMIDDEICKVCGRPAHKGSEPYEFMVKNSLIISHICRLKKRKKREKKKRNNCSLINILMN